MSNLALDECIAVNRDELIRRCRTKVRTRSAPPPTKAELDQGVPLFLDRQEITRDGESQELRNLVSTAVTAFEVLRTGNVGVGGSTAAILERSLKAIREITDRPLKGGETAAPGPR